MHTSAGSMHLGQECLLWSLSQCPMAPANCWCMLGNTTRSFAWCRVGSACRGRQCWSFSHYVSSAFHPHLGLVSFIPICASLGVWRDQALEEALAPRLRLAGDSGSLAKFGDFFDGRSLEKGTGLILFYRVEGVLEVALLPPGTISYSQVPQPLACWDALRHMKGSLLLRSCLTGKKVVWDTWSRARVRPGRLSVWDDKIVCVILKGLGSCRGEDLVQEGKAQKGLPQYAFWVARS